MINKINSKDVKCKSKHTRMNNGRKASKRKSKSYVGAAEGTSRSDKDDINVSNVRDYNDPSWYNASNQLVVDACSIGFATPLGIPLKVHGEEFQVPGICRINYVPSIGLSLNNVSPINMAAQSIYSYVNYANSRNTSYDRTDLMMYMLAMDSAYSYLSTMKRIYGIARLYSATNRYMPQTLISSMNIKFFDIIKNLADFRAYINTYAWKLGSFFVPASFTYLKRHSWMNYNVFSDSDKVFKSQLYYYYQQAYYKYNETTSPTGTTLIYTPAPGVGTGSATFTQLQEFGDNLLAPLLNSQDIGIMGSDILKAFGESGLIKMDTINEDFVVDVAYSPEVLNQIQNTIAVGDLSVSQHLADITQSNGYISQALKVSATGADTYIQDVDNYFLNMPMTNPSPDDVMVSTRNMSWVDKNEQVHSGADVVTKLYYYNDATSASSRVEVTSSMYMSTTDPASIIGTYRDVLSVVPAFNMHPRVIIGADITGSSARKFYPIILGDFDNYTPLPIIDLQKMHEVALLSMFAVPQYGTFNG